MTHDGREVANFVLDQCERNGRTVTNLSLQKIVYFCHVWSLVKLGKPLIRHSFEAWQHGPVLQYLYREFKRFDNAPVKGRATRIDPASGRKVLVAYEFDEPTRQLLEQTVNFYSRIAAFNLVELTHAKGGPWDVVWHHGGSVNPGMKIDDREIARFYSSAPEVAQ